jgi:hypothetical protein
MTTAPRDLAASAKERISADVPADVAQRLRTWAALRRKRAAHIVAELVAEAVPTDEQLKGLIGQKGAGNGHADH